MIQSLKSNLGTLMAKVRNFLRDILGRPASSPPGSTRQRGKRSRRFQSETAYSKVAVVRTQAEAFKILSEENAIVLIEGQHGFKLAQFKCPCGCSETLRINLSRSAGAAWRYRLDRSGRCSLYPSVDRTSGCYSHFMLVGNVARMLTSYPPYI